MSKGGMAGGCKEMPDKVGRPKVETRKKAETRIPKKA
jgi:hypothetical protein